MDSVDFARRMQALEDKIGYHFQDKNLLEQALTHSSYAYESQDPTARDNERLEFLGDTVLSTVISRILFEHPAGFDEGKMTKFRSLIVRKESLYKIATEIELLDSMRFGQGEEKSGGRKTVSNAEDAMEALIGAIFLDRGFDFCVAFVKKHFYHTFSQAISGELVYDYKSQVYELLQQKEDKPAVQFILLKKSGPDHDKRFTVTVEYKNRRYSLATERSKRAAEQLAAKNFLDEYISE